MVWHGMDPCGPMCMVLWGDRVEAGHGKIIYHCDFGHMLLSHISHEYMTDVITGHVTCSAPVAGLHLQLHVMLSLRCTCHCGTYDSTAKSTANMRTCIQCSSMAYICQAGTAAFNLKHHA